MEQKIIKAEEFVNKIRDARNDADRELISKLMEETLQKKMTAAKQMGESRQRMGILLDSVYIKIPLVSEQLIKELNEAGWKTAIISDGYQVTL